MFFNFGETSDSGIGIENENDCGHACASADSTDWPRGMKIVWFWSMLLERGSVLQNSCWSSRMNSKLGLLLCFGQSLCQSQWSVCMPPSCCELAFVLQLPGLISIVRSAIFWFLNKTKRVYEWCWLRLCSIFLDTFPSWSRRMLVSGHAIWEGECALKSSSGSCMTSKLGFLVFSCFGQRTWWRWQEYLAAGLFQNHWKCVPPWLLRTSFCLAAARAHVSWMICEIWVPQAKESMSDVGSVCA